MGPQWLWSHILDTSPVYDRTTFTVGTKKKKKETLKETLNTHTYGQGRINNLIL